MNPSRPLRLAGAFWAAVALSIPAPLLAQVADVPVRPGLWETHVITQAGDRTIDAGPDQACFSAGTTLGDYLSATNKSTPGVKCTVSDRTVTANAISYDTTCTGEGAGSRGHIDFRVPDPGHISGTSRTTVTRTSHGKSTTMQIDKTYSASFLRAACGDVAAITNR